MREDKIRKAKRKIYFFFVNFFTFKKKNLKQSKFTSKRKQKQKKCDLKRHWGTSTQLLQYTANRQKKITDKRTNI